jgi:elongation factor Ts
MSNITAADVNKLRKQTGAGMMDCKKALVEAEGDFEKAIDILRAKGQKVAAKRGDRDANEGLVIAKTTADGKKAVMVVVNCETDFVARRSEFQELARNIAMQIAACPQVQYINAADIPPEIAEREKKIEMEKDDLGNKPVDIKEKIVEGRIQKKLKEMVLVDQAFIRDSSMTIGELVKQNISTLGENIQIRRFERFVLGEGLEKKNEDFGAEVEKMMSK